MILNGSPLQPYSHLAADKKFERKHNQLYTIKYSHVSACLYNFIKLEGLIANQLKKQTTIFFTHR